MFVQQRPVSSSLVAHAAWRECSIGGALPSFGRLGLGGTGTYMYMHMEREGEKEGRE